jgi:hypothetical protein
MEHKYIRLIEAGIRGLTMGTKAPDETKAPMCLNLLKPINKPMYEELLGKWALALDTYTRKDLKKY